MTGDHYERVTMPNTNVNILKSFYSDKTYSYLYACVIRQTLSGWWYIILFLNFDILSLMWQSAYDSSGYRIGTRHGDENRLEEQGHWNRRTKWNGEFVLFYSFI